MGRLFGTSNGTKMSTPGLKKRSKSALGKRTHGNTHNSEKKRDRKKARQIVPSSNDHKFNSGTNSKLNRKVQRNPTPYKKNLFDGTMKSGMKTKRASSKPVFGAINESAESVSCDEDKLKKNETKKLKKKKKNLAFDPNKVTSRLFQSTSSSNNKMRKVNEKKIKKRAETPQVRSSVGKMKKMGKSKNWTNVKSKINTGRKAVKSDGENKNCGVKRRLDWLKESDQEKNGRSASQPPSKKRRMSVQTKERRWQ